MKIEIDKVGLIKLIVNTRVGYLHLQNADVKRYMIYEEGDFEVTWKEQLLLELTEQNLYNIYLFLITR